MKAKQLAAALRLGHATPNDQVADEIDRLVAELVGLQLWQANLLERIRRIPNKSMAEGYYLMRRVDVVRAIDRKAAQMEPDDE